MDTELLIVTILKALVELAGVFLLGQGVLYLLAGRDRGRNLFYQLLRVLTGPAVRFTRLITPRAIVDRHIPLVAFLILFWVWMLLTFAKIQICATAENRCKPEAQAAVPQAVAVTASSWTTRRFLG